AAPSTGISSKKPARTASGTMTSITSFPASASRAAARKLASPANGKVRTRRSARADYDRRARSGEAEREAEPLAPRPPDEGDRIHRHPALPLTAAEHTGRRPAMESAGPGAYSAP